MILFSKEDKSKGFEKTGKCTTVNEQEQSNIGEEQKLAFAHP